MELNHRGRDVAELTIVYAHERRPLLPPVVDNRDAVERVATELAERLRLPLDTDVEAHFRS